MQGVYLYCVEGCPVAFTLISITYAGPVLRKTFPTELCNLVCVNGNYYPDHCGCNCTAFFTGSQCDGKNEALLLCHICGILIEPNIIPFSVQPHLCQWRDPEPDPVPAVQLSTTVYRNQLF